MSSGKNTSGMWIWMVWTVCASLYLSVSAGVNTFNAPVSQCVRACPGDVLSYNCTVVGGIATVWRGTAFDCPTTTNNEIILRHSRFSDGTFGSCSGGIIRGRSLGVQDSTCYISQVNVTVNSGHNGQTVECTIDPSLEVVGSATILTAPYPPPVNVSFTSANSTSLSFSWDSVSPNCSTIFYNIFSSNCGLCPTSTRSSSATCSIVEQLARSSEAINCSFAVQSIACGNIASANSDAVTAILKVPDAPEVTIIPIYDSSRRLTGLNIGIIEIPFAISDGVDGSSLSYKVTLLRSDKICASSSTNASVCRNGSFNCSIEVSSSSCPGSGDITVDITGTSVLGEGSVNRSVVGGVNRFVLVIYNSSAPSLMCQFLDQSSTVDKSCAVVYGPCGQVLDRRIGVRAKTNVITLSLEINETETANDLCYQITASNTTYSAVVNGTLADFEADSGAFPVAAVVIPLVVVTLLGFCIVLFIILLYKFTYTVVDKRSFTLLHVTKDSELREFVEEGHRSFKRGCAFFEFVNEFENISRDKKVILRKNNTGKLYTSEKLKRDIGAPGERIPRRTFKGYTLFVQSLGSGSRHVKPGTTVLYQELQSHAERHDFRRVEDGHFTIKKIKKTCSLQEYFLHTFKKTLYGKQKMLFLDVKLMNENDVIDDALLMDEENKCYVGPGAIRCAEDSLKQHPDTRKRSYIAGVNITGVFVLCKNLSGDLKLNEGSTVVHQDVTDRFDALDKRFHTFKVEQKCVMLTEFLCEKLSDQKVDIKKAFYEFTREEEDLFNDTEVLLYDETFTSEKVGCGRGMLYSIPGAPGIGVKNPRKAKFRVFVQCNGSGYRFLKKGATVLYKKENLKRSLQS